MLYCSTYHSTVLDVHLPQSNNITNQQTFSLFIISFIGVHQRLTQCQEALHQTVSINTHSQNPVYKQGMTMIKY